jgi:hypothetical protein
MFLRPGLISSNAPRAAKVKVCRKQPPEAARSDLDGSEHGVTFLKKGRKLFLTPLSQGPAFRSRLAVDETSW